MWTACKCVCRVVGLAIRQYLVCFFGPSCVDILLVCDFVRDFVCVCVVVCVRVCLLLSLIHISEPTRPY